MVEEGREIKATWLWFITHTSEEEINKFIRKHQWLLNIPITYDCNCGDQQCCIKTEYFKMENEKDLVVLYQNILSGTCTSTNVSNIICTSPYVANNGYTFPDVTNNGFIHPNVENNSCTSSDLANNTCTHPDVENNSSISPDVACNTCTSSDVENDTCTLPDMANNSSSSSDVESSTSASLDAENDTCTLPDMANNKSPSSDVASNDCTSSDLANSSCTSAAVANTESSVVLNMSILRESEKICPGLRSSLFRNANTVGIYAAHIFAARNLKSCFATAQKLHDKIPNHITYKKGLRIIDLLLEHKRYDILDSTVRTGGWIFGLGRVYREKFHRFTANSMLTALELVIKKNDAQACQILLPSILSRCNFTLTYHVFKGVVEKIVQHNALDCLQVLIPYLRKFGALTKRIENGMILKCLQQKEAMKLLVQNQILPLSPCLRLAVKENEVEFVRWVADLYPLYGDKEEEGLSSLLLQAIINDSPAMVETLLQATKYSYRSLRCRRVPLMADDFGLALKLAKALKMTRCTEVLSDFDSHVFTDVYRQKSLSSVVLNTQSKKYSKVELLKRLIEDGYDINTCVGEHGGVPPLYDAVVNSDVELIKALLSSGASLFNEKDISMLGCPPRLLAEYIYRNVDICTESGSVLNDILESKKREKLLYLVLRCAHTIPQTDREKLRQLCLQEDFYGYTKVSKFLNSPRRLTILSRNSLRKHYAHEIHWFLANAVLPPKVRDFISLERQLEPYLALPLKFSKAYDDLVGDRFDPDFDDEI